MARLGVRFDFSPQFTHQDVLDLVLLAEERGYETVWVPEGGGLDSLTQLSAFATATSRIRLGTGILPVFSRTATLVAMSAAGLDILSNHRFILGLGVGHRGAVEAYHGIPFRRPITRLRETVEVVRRLLNGERLEYEGQVFNVRGAGLGLPQGLQVPIYIAALGPRVVELAGELADGVLLTWAAPAYLDQTLAHLQQGAARAGRRREDVDVACYIRVAVAEDLEAARGPLRQQILRYLGMEYYRNYFEQTGFQEEVQAISRYLANGDTQKALSAISDGMQRELAVFGPADFCREEIERRRALGLTMPVIAPFAVGDARSSYRAAIEAFTG